ncbi:MAG: YkgJ family cysteine cluster protein [Methanotrichaceae archaeon]
MNLRGFPEEKKKRLLELRSKLEVAKGISAESLASQIRQIGFECKRCGECCTGEDNSVVVFPFEIRNLQKATDEPQHEIAEPPSDGEWDESGNFHTLEWRLKKEKGSCKFYTDEECKCYGSRPLLCRTYPFYLDDGVLCFSECKGLGLKIGKKESEEIAAGLIERNVTEIVESIALLEKYEDFERGRPSANGVCIIHDSEGEHRMPLRLQLRK